MNHFPVSNSNLSAPHLNVFLQEKYALGPQTACRIIRAGINDTYLLEGNARRFVFRVYSLNWRTPTEIMEEIRLLNELKEQGVSVSYALPDIQNNYIQLLNAPEGDRYGVLFSYAEGQKMHSVPAETHYNIGVLMARFHQLTQNRTLNRITYTPDVLLSESLEQLRRFLGADTTEMRFLESTQALLLQAFSEADMSHIRQGIVHLDIWFDNLNVGADNKATLFDFDFCGNGWLALDISYYVMQLHNLEKYDAALYQPKVDHFINGYESVLPISDEEKRLFPLLGVSLYFFYLGIQCRRYDNWSNSFLSEDYLKRFINGLVKRYFDIYR